MDKLEYIPGDLVIIKKIWVFFIGDDKHQNVKEAIKLGAFNHTMHYFMIDLKQWKKLTLSIWNEDES